MFICVFMCNLDAGSSPRELINYYYTYLETHMDADSVSHMMHCNHLITDDDYKAIIAAPNDHKMNTVLLQYIRAMDTNLFIKFCDILKNIETQKIIGLYLSNYSKTCKIVYENFMHICITTYVHGCCVKQ